MGVNMLKKIICGILVIMCAVFSLSAQQREQPEQRERTIEELYLSQSIELQLIRNQVASNDWEVRSLAIQSLRNMAQEGRINEDNSAVFLILEEVAKPIEQGGNQKNFNLIRREACSILGDVGGARSQQILLEVLSLDREPTVLSEAVYALGKIGSDPTGIVLTKMMYLLHNENVKTTPDNNFAYATLLSIGKLIKGKDGIKAADQIGPLIELLGCNYKKEVKRKAMEIIFQLQS